MLVVITFLVRVLYGASNMKVKHTQIRPFWIRCYMGLLDADGLTTPWGTIYYRTPYDLQNPRLKRHELKHIEQMEREGILKFLIKYNYYWIKYGYKYNPYEIEARKAENG